MEDYSKIGLLDFQSRSDHFTPLFNNFSQNNGFLPFKEQSKALYNQNADFETVNGSKHLQRNCSSNVKTSNLEDLMSGCSLMYVSGDSHGMDSSKLQLEICSDDCCNSRVKYARVRVQRDKESDIWSSAHNNRINNTIAPPGHNGARSSWDLGSDGASTPGSNSWGDMFGAVGPVTRSNSQWTSSGDLGYGSNNVFLDPPRGDTYLDTWAACDALLETEKAFGDEEANDFSEHWNKFHLKARPQF